VERASCSTLAGNARSCGHDLPWVGASSRRRGRMSIAADGTRRAADGARRDPKTCHQTVTDRDRDSTRRESQPGVSHASSPVLNTMQFLALRPSADLARKQSGFNQLAGEHVPRRKACQLTKAGQVTGPANEDSARRSELVKRALRSTGRSAPWSWGRPGQSTGPRALPAAAGPHQGARVHTRLPRARCGHDAAAPTPPCPCRRPGHPWPRGHAGPAALGVAASAQRLRPSALGCSQLPTVDASQPTQCL
jgi:hypothetical protein